MLQLRTLLGAIALLSIPIVAPAQGLSPVDLAAIASGLSNQTGQAPADTGTAPVRRADAEAKTPPDTVSKPAKPLTRELFPGAEPLTPFGYEVFERAARDPGAAMNLPAPVDYVLAAGDTLEVLIIAERGGRFTLNVSRDGEINVPQIGPISVAGQRFAEAKKSIEERISTQISGARANVTLGAMRSLQIFVLGEAKDPGPRTVPALSTISSALMASGGIKPTGSLRNVELRRSGALIARLDLYDLLVRGDASRDLRLLAGDVLFIPPVGALIGVSGAVKRPGIYELKAGAESLQGALELAGGFDGNADRRQGTLNRIAAGAKRETVSLDLTQKDALSSRVRDGDLLRVEFNLPVVAAQVELLGHLHRPGKRAVSENTRIADLIGSIDELKSGSDPGYLFIAREDRVTGERTALSADLRAAWKDPLSAANVRLVSGDRLVAFEADRPREQIIRCIMRPEAVLREREELTKLVEKSERPDLPQPVGKEPLTATEKSLEADTVVEIKNPDPLTACFDDPPKRPKNSDDTGPVDPAPPYATVNLSGALRTPGLYPFGREMRVSDLVRAGGGLSDRAFTLKAELVRYVVGADQIRRREVLVVDVQKALAGDESADAIVLPYDEFAVRTIPEWNTRSTVTLEGEVMFPGTYSIAPGETLRGLLERAGGLKTTAFVQGAFFSRESLRQRELEQLRKLQSDLRRDVAAQQRELLARDDGGEAAKLTKLLSTSLETVQDNPALGRLSIDLDKVMRGDVYSRNDLLLKDGDKLFLPPRADEVTVIGEVFAQSSHVYERGLTVEDYLSFAGGLRSTADEKGAYIMSASGRARPLKSGLWRGASPAVRPGDTIIVPVKIPKLRDPILQTVGEVTQILYNLSLGAAAVKSLGN
jgi:polysaccharide export outer membrane protein